LSASGQDVFTPGQFGAVGDGKHDDTAALQAMVDAMPDYAQAEFAARQKFKITSTIIIQDREGLKFIGKSGVGSAASANHNNPQFLWYGPSGATMWFINRSRGLVIQGLTWIVNDYFLPNKANVALDWDMNPTLPGHITSDSIIERCSIWNSGSANPDFVGIRIAFTSHENCEFIVIKESNINSSGGSGVGVRIGPSYNAKGIRLEGVSINRCEKGVWLVTGSMTATSNNHSANKVDYWIDNATEPVMIDKTVSESERFLYNGCSDAPITLRGNKWEGPTPAGLSPIEYGPSGGWLIVESNYFGAPPANTPFFKPNSNASLTSMNNIYNFAQAAANLGAFPLGAITFRDSWRGGGNSDFNLARKQIRGIGEAGDVRHIIGRGSDQTTASNYNVISIDEDKLGTQFGADVRLSGALRQIVPTLTSNTILTGQSPSIMMVDASAGDFTVTLPAASTYDPSWKISSPLFTIKKLNYAGIITINVEQGQLIERNSVFVLSRDGRSVTLVSDGKQWRILSMF